MPIMQIAIIEDEKLYSDQLIKLLQTYSKKTHFILNISSFKSGEKFFQHDIRFDIVFLDIELPGMNGMEIAKKLRAERYNGEIIFLTNHADYVFQGYDVRALHYLLKPVGYEAIHKCMQFFHGNRAEESFTFKTGNVYMKVPFYNILYFSSCNHYIEVYTKHDKYSFKGNLKDIAVNVPSNFKQCHRSLIVNINYIESITGKEIFLCNGERLPISNTFVESIRKSIVDSIAF